MITFTDLVSLLLTFFVMLFAMSNVMVDKWEAMIDALSQTLNPSQTKTTAAATAQYNISTTFRKRAVNLDYLAVVLQDTIQEDDLLRQAQILRLDDRLIIALPGDLLFPRGTAQLSNGARRALFGLGGVLRNVGNQIAVDGHTDPTIPEGGEYLSHWELSIARSAAVSNMLRRSGYTDQILALGYADTRYAQLPEMKLEKRHALARRVDIVIMSTVGGD